MQGNERIPRGIPGRLQRTLIFMALPFVCASCGIMPEEEELPAAPVIRSYEAAEYEQALVMRGDMILTKKVKCTYASAKQEKYSFSLGGMYIDKVYVSEGQQVKKGTLLAELEQGDLPRQISDGEYALRALQVGRAYLPEYQRLDRERQDAIIADMEGQIKELMAWSRNYEPGEPEGAAYVDRANAVLIQQIELEKQKDADAQTNEKQLQEADDAVYIAGIRLQELKEELRERQIYADINGTVTYLQKMKEGERSVKGKVFVTVADLDTVVFTVKGEDAGYFPVGTQATVLCEKKEYPAQSVDPSVLGLAEQQEGDEPMAYLQLLQPDPTLENGVSGTIEVILDQREDVLYVPRDAIKAAEGAKFVYMLDENGLRVLREIATGLEDGEYVEILSGREEGDSVIIN